MKIIGHRGARGLAPENTIAALRKGLEHRVDELEFDVRVTKDGVAVLHHDPDVSDPADDRFKISDYSYKQLRAYKPDLAGLEEALSAVGHKVPLYIEVKPGEPVKPVIKLLRDRLADGWPAEYLRLASKDQAVLVKLHKALPELPKIVIEPWSGIRATRRARQIGTKRLSMNQLWLWWGFIRAMKRGGWELYTYTLNDPKKARRWARWGLAGVVTDYPDLYQPARHDPVK